MDNEKIKITYEEMHEESDINFPKLSFMSYIFNIIYCSCCNIKNQKFISKCNEIVSKYYFNKLYLPMTFIQSKKYYIIKY